MEESQTKNNIFRFQDTTATRTIFSLKQRIRAVKGGTSASKTISILVWHIDYAQTKQKFEKISTIVSESFPHLDDGVIRDFKLIMQDRGYWNDARWNATQHFYTFETGNILEFESFDTYGKAHGPRRDTLYLNECNNLPWNIVDQLITRTREVVWLDWNPTEEFWFHTEMLPNRSDIDYITLTYKDNEALDQVSIMEIESHKHNKRWWDIYGLGQDGVIEGKIYKDWKIIEEIPHEARLLSYGLDYGYTNDPTAIVAIYYFNAGYIFDEISYTRGLSNKKIGEIFEAISAAPIIPDSAEPKSNDELKSYGLTVLPATKGKGSVSQGIQFVQDCPCSITKRSVNIIKEYRNYVFKQDPITNKILNEPEHEFSHSMDAIRYGMQIKYKPNQSESYTQPAYEIPGLGKTAVSISSDNSPHSRFKGRFSLSNSHDPLDDSSQYPNGTV